MKLVNIDYTNYRGERSWYRVLPHLMYFGHTVYHPHDQWLLKTTSCSVGSEGQERIFAVACIHEWREATDQTLPWRSK